GIETTPEEENRALVEHFGGLHDLAVRQKHGCSRQASLDQLQGAEAVVEESVAMPVELQHVHFDPSRAEVLHQGGNEAGEVSAVTERGVDEVHSDDPDRLHLLGIGGVE